MSAQTVEDIDLKIVAVEVAISDALNVAEYRLDTGQSNQRVQKQPLSELRSYLRELRAQRAGLVDGNVFYIDAGFGA